MRPTVLILFVLAVVAGGGLFGVAFEVSALEERLIVLNKQITDDRDAIHVLRAEWSYLNQPERLEGLSRRYLEMQPLEGGQISEIAALPVRPAAPAPSPEAAPEVTAPTETPVAGALIARPKVKPAAPRRQSRHIQLASQPARLSPTPTPVNDVSDRAALDAALREILGDAARRNGAARR